MKLTAMSLEDSALEASINGLVKEYLEKCGFSSTVGAFEKECWEGDRPVKVLNSKERAQKTCSDLLPLFDKGLQPRFFQKWEMLLPNSSRKTESMQRLEFQLHIYFAIYPLKHYCRRKPTAEEDEAMKYFRCYLESKAADLSQMPEFLAYYALPYVPAPKDHPSFKELFEISWDQELRTKLLNSIESAWAQAEPEVLALWLSREQMATDAQSHILRSQEKALSTQRQLKQIKKRYTKVQENYDKLLGVASELTLALESCICGNPINLETTLGTCMRLFPELFSGGSWSTAPPTEIIKESLQRQVPQHAQTLELDYYQIKKDLLQANTKAKLLLLQALRWRLSRSPNMQFREKVMQSYVENDILGLHSQPTNTITQPPHYREVLLGYLTSPDPHPLQQALSRFLNTIASLSQGREYLSQQKELLEKLVDCILTQRLDKSTKEMMLATLQKLSLRRIQQNEMIQRGIVEWLIEYLQGYQSLSRYSLEYAAALFMNLSLREAGRQRCVPQAITVLKLLAELLGADCSQVVPYVNGALFSLLGQPEIKAEAERIGLEQVLEYYMRNGNGDLPRQLDYILRFYNGDRDGVAHPISSDHDDEEIDEDAEVLEEELDQEDPVQAMHGDLSGDHFLGHFYGIFIRNRPFAEEKKPPPIVYQRPVTPGRTSRPSTAEARGFSRSSINSTGDLFHRPSFDFHSQPDYRPHISFPNPSPRRGQETAYVKPMMAKNRNENEETIAEEETATATSEEPPKVLIQQDVEVTTVSSEGNSPSDASVIQAPVQAAGRKSDTPGSRRGSLLSRRRTSESKEIIPPAVTPGIDEEATEVLSRVFGEMKPVAEAQKVPNPEDPLLQSIPPQDAVEYVTAFSTRPKIPRTPPGGKDAEQPGSRPATQASRRAQSPHHLPPINMHRAIPTRF